MKSLYIRLKIADIGRGELTNDLGVVSKRIPGWLIPDEILLECDLAVESRHVLRPDILLIEVTQAEQTMYTAPEDHALLTPVFFDPSLQLRQQPHPRQLPAHPVHRRRKIWLLEGWYTSDTRHLGKKKKRSNANIERC